MEKTRNIRLLRWAVAALSVLLALAIALNIRHSSALADARTRIGAVYQKAFYETCQLTEAIASNYRKLTVAGDDARILSLLGEISRETQGASGNLALLPLGEETVSATIKFINQAEDFAESLSERVASGGAVTEADYEAINTLSHSAEKFHAAMLSLLARYERGEVVFDASDFRENGAEQLYPLSGPGEGYPKLLYDGPFSDAETTGSYELLRELPEISSEQARQRLEAFTPADEISYIGESRPEIACYEFRFISGGNSISAAVTKNGGMILYLLPENDVTEIKIDEQTLIERGAAFLREKGFGEMQMSYFSAFDGILTINFAAVQDGVVLYPDLIKLQMSMADGSVIGLDARGYLRNHRARALPEIKIDAETAQANISPRLNALGAQLCIIPKDGKEYFTWEIRAADEEAGFLVYVDAETGIERDLMQIVDAEQGTLVK